MEEVKAQFEAARLAYPGTKNGLDTEFKNFIWRGTHPVEQKQNKEGFGVKFKPEEIAPILLENVKRQKHEREVLKSRNQFAAPWKNFQTWINHNWWAAELVEVKKHVKYKDEPMEPCLYCQTLCRPDSTGKAFCPLPATCKGTYYSEQKEAFFEQKG